MRAVEKYVVMRLDNDGGIGIWSASNSLARSMRDIREQRKKGINLYLYVLSRR